MPNNAALMTCPAAVLCCAALLCSALCSDAVHYCFALLPWSEGSLEALLSFGVFLVTFHKVFVEQTEQSGFPFKYWEQDNIVMGVEKLLQKCPRNKSKVLAKRTGWF